MEEKTERVRLRETSARGRSTEAVTDCEEWSQWRVLQKVVVDYCTNGDVAVRLAPTSTRQSAKR